MSEVEPEGRLNRPPTEAESVVALVDAVTVVIVSYNTLALVLASVKLLEETGVPVIVVDNASTDGTPHLIAENFPNVHLVRNDVNVGFGAANNQGMDLADTELVLLLNSDCSASEGAISTLVRCFDDPSVVAAGGKLLHPDGTLQESAANRLTLWAVVCEQLYLERLAPAGSRLSPYWVSSRLAHLAGPHDVEQVMGACLMLRPVERFDERFFLYCEDTELCHRLKRHGRVVYEPAAEFVHLLGASSRDARWMAVARYNRGKELYFAIHHGPLSCAVCWCLNRLGALLRLLVWTIATIATLGKTKEKVTLFGRVLFAPFRGPALPTDAQVSK